MQENWNATGDALNLNPADGMTRASSFVEAVCAEILRERGVPLPDNKSMKPLIETVLATLPWPDDAQLLADVKRLTSGVSTVCQAIGTLRTHYGSAHGASTHLPPADPAYAMLTKNAGAAVAIFLLDRHRNGGITRPPESD
ncbi:abortive infection family protein [Burkholderia sp. AU45388]|uniref:abortive infection family protein n=1 Tax=Burkholderia sp. AU45388 TaxID=3059206 RepID=UPI0026567F9D|nr:abortive infection family protein [Burkholderia sp. AU45388]MDN7431412.1 abortive infection family protein [Burkholderia sp. AU45388]